MQCLIRKWKIEDAKSLADAISNKKVQDNLRDGLPFPYTIEDAKDYINAMLNADMNSTFAFAITVNDQAIGSIGIFRQDNIHSCTAEVGYYISEDHWHKGFGSSALKQACDFVFNNTDIIRIFAEPFSYNQASCRILEKVGFEYEGTLRKNAIKNGKVIDMNMYSLIKK